jgi:hypothetical protein
MSAHANAAEILRMLAGSPQPELFDTLTDDAVRLVLKLTAEACENLNDVEQERDQAVMYAAELRSLLDRVAALLDALPSPAEGGAWRTYTVAEEVRRARGVKLPAAGQRLFRELSAARQCVRAATALVLALREHDTARVRACVEVFEEANQACEAAGS